MDPERAGTPAEQRARLGAVGVATGLGCSVVVSLIGLIGGGLLLDEVTGSTPVFTLVGVALGLVVAGYQLYELTLIGVRDRSPGPLGRALSKLPARRPSSGGGGESRS